MLNEKYNKSISTIENSSNSRVVAVECNSLISMLISDVANGEDVSVLKPEASKINIALTGNVKREDDLDLKRFFKVTYTLFNGYVYDKVGKNKISIAKRVKDILTLLSTVETKRMELDIIPSLDLTKGTMLVGGININETAFRSYTINKLPITCGLEIDSKNEDIYAFDEYGCCNIDGICSDDVKYILDNAVDTSKHNIALKLVNVNKLGISKIVGVNSYFVFLAPKYPYADNTINILDELTMSDKSKLVMCALGNEECEDIPYSKICGISYK